MIDPMAALKSLEDGLCMGISLIECELNSSIDFILDFPAGEQSMCYANIEQGAVKSLAALQPVEPIDGVPCFSIVFAVSEAYQRQRLAFEIVAVAIAELRHSLGRNGIVEFYIEATIAVHNVGARKVALKQLSAEFDMVFFDMIFDEAVDNAVDKALDKLVKTPFHRYRRLVACA